MAPPRLVLLPTTGFGEVPLHHTPQLLILAVLLTLRCGARIGQCRQAGMGISGLRPCRRSSSSQRPCLRCRVPARHRPRLRTGRGPSAALARRRARPAAACQEMGQQLVVAHAGCGRPTASMGQQLVVATHAGCGRPAASLPACTIAHWMVGPRRGGRLPGILSHGIGGGCGGALPLGVADGIGGRSGGRLPRADGIGGGGCGGGMPRPIIADAGGVRARDGARRRRLLTLTWRLQWRGRLPWPGGWRRPRLAALTRCHRC